MKPIVVAIGEHDDASPALRWAAELATLTSVPLEVLSVCSPTYAEISPELFDNFVGSRRADLISVLDAHPEGWHRHSDDIRAQVGKVSAAPIMLYLATGHPTEVLLEHTERDEASMVVVGTRGHGGFGGLRLGRVPSQLLAHVSSPLLVVPKSAIEDRRA